MEIICPECQFSREVDETKIPARSQVATCPKCQMKFKFRELPEETFEMENPDVPKPERESEQPSGPRQASLLDQAPTPPKQARPARPASPEPTFPNIPEPGEDPRDELWDKLGGMAPPDKDEKPAPIRPEPRNTYADNRTEDEPQPVPGWTGEFNDDFPDPMQFDDEENDDTDSPMQVPPPFEQLDRYGFFHGLFLTIKLLIVSPRLFFSVTPVGGGLSKPLTFAILISMVQAFFQLTWGSIGLTTGLGIEGTQMVHVPFEISTGLMELLLAPARVAVTIFLFAGVFHLLLILLKGNNKGFEATFRATAYSSAPIIFGIFPMPTMQVIMVWVLVCGIWTTVLNAIGLKYVHGISYNKVIPAMLIPVLLCMILAVYLIQGQLTTI